MGGRRLPLRLAHLSVCFSLYAVWHSLPCGAARRLTVGRHPVLGRRFAGPCPSVARLSLVPSPAALATTGAAADEHLLAEVLWHHRRLSKLAVSELVADAKYGTATNYLSLDQASIAAFIPPTRFGHQHTGIWGRERFRWLPEEDVFLCPAGQRLRRYSNMRPTRRVRYQAPEGSCTACCNRPVCAPSGRARSVHRSWGQDLVEEALVRTASPLGKQRLAERRMFVEGAFALAKELHGLRRTRLRGRRRVQIQLWLTAAAMNIKKAIQAGPTTGPLSAATAFLSRLHARRRGPALHRARVLPLI